MGNFRARDKKLFGFGALTGVIMLSISLASVPSHEKLVDDTAIYQNISEIKVKPDAKPNFDADIAHLSELEKRYREKLPVAEKNRVKLTTTAKKKPAPKKPLHTAAN
jgi:hypothetical protein